MLGRPDVLLAVDSLVIGGTQRVVTRLAKWMSEVGLLVHVVTMYEEERGYELPPDVGRTALVLARDRRRRRVRLLRAYVDFLKTHRPGVVISFGAGVNVPSILAARVTGTPVTISERTAPEMHIPGPATRLLRPWIYRFASALVIQTESLRPWAEEVMRGGRIEVIPNAVEAPAVTTRGRPSSRRVLSVGRLHYQKGHDLLIRAFGDSRDALEGWELRIVGEGPERTALESLVAELSLQGRVLLPGQHSDVWHEYQSAGVFVLPSRYEGFPNALLEAMATGLPVIATDCPHGPNELVRDGIDGLLVPGESVDSLAAALSTLVQSAELQATLGESARERATQFSREAVTRRWLDVALGEAHDKGN